MTVPRSIDQIVEDQVRRWQLSRRKEAPEHHRDPVIAISRLSGCCGRALAEELARRMGFDFFHKEILIRVAESSHLSEAIIKTVDEKTISAVEEWVQSLFTERYLTGDYFHHLCKVLMTIAEHGRAVILGRGASLIIPPKACLRVLLLAPMEERVAVVAGRDGLSREEARRRVIQTDSERRAFIRRHFHTDMLDPVHYDLVLNTAGLGREGTLAVIENAWKAKK